MTRRFIGRLFRLLTIVILLGFYPNTMGAAHSASDLSSDRKENEPNKPVQIVNMAVSPDPAVGQHSTLTVAFITTRDEPRVTLDIQLPQGIELVSGDLHWEGSLTPGQTQSHSIGIIVKEAGDLKIMALANIPVSEKSSITDTNSIHIINEAGQKTEVISDINYTLRAPQAKALQPVSKAMPLAPQSAGDTITLSGKITYDATS